MAIEEVQLPLKPITLRKAKNLSYRPLAPRRTPLQTYMQTSMPALARNWSHAGQHLWLKYTAVQTRKKLKDLDK